MRKGVYVTKPSFIIWTIEEFEHYEDLLSEFIIVTKGYCNGRDLRRCLITKSQFKLFYRIGEL